jgi:ATP-dependent DNA helicase RecG
VIDLVHREQRVPAYLAPRVQRLLEHGVIERVGRGRGTRYLLSRRFYRFLGRAGAYTRRRGLDRETNKSLLLRHIADSDATGARFGELQQVLPELSRNQVQGLLRALRDEGRIRVEGQRRWARWLPAPAKRRNESEIAKRSKPDA